MCTPNSGSTGPKIALLRNERTGEKKWKMEEIKNYFNYDHNGFLFMIIIYLTPFDTCKHAAMIFKEKEKLVLIKWLKQQLKGSLVCL